jgi:hypothetical protein
MALARARNSDQVPSDRSPFSRQYSHQSIAKRNPLMAKGKTITLSNRGCLKCPPPALDVRKRTGDPRSSGFMRPVVVQPNSSVDPWEPSCTSNETTDTESNRSFHKPNSGELIREVSRAISCKRSHTREMIRNKSLLCRASAFSIGWPLPAALFFPVPKAARCSQPFQLSSFLDF